MGYIVYYFLVEGLSELPIIKTYITQKVIRKYFLIYPTSYL